MRIERARRIRDEAEANVARLVARLRTDGHELNQAVKDSIAKQIWIGRRAVRAIEDKLREAEISEVDSE